MRITAIACAAVLAALTACGGKRDPGAGSAGSGASATVIAPCAPGSLRDGTGVCVVVAAPAQVTAVTAQKTRIDELGSQLDKLDALTAPIELIAGFRQLDEWKTLSATSDKLRAVDAVVATLGEAVKQLRAFRQSLGAVSQQLGDLKGDLDQLIAGTGAAKNLADARAQISTRLRALVTPYAQTTSDTIQRAIAPLQTQLADVADLVAGACAMAKLSGGSDALKQLCTKARDTFTQALAFLDQIKARPAAIFDQVTAELLGKLDALVDDGTRAAIAAAQQQVDRALATGGGSAAVVQPPAQSAVSAGSGSGSNLPATPPP